MAKPSTKEKEAFEGELEVNDYMSQLREQARILVRSRETKRQLIRMIRNPEITEEDAFTILECWRNILQGNYLDRYTEITALQLELTTLGSAYPKPSMPVLFYLKCGAVPFF